MSDTTKQTQNLTPEVKIGDFIKAQYKCGLTCGIVIEIKKSIFVIKECQPFYNDYTLTDYLINITKTRIYQIGLNQDEKIIYKFIIKKP